MLDTYIEAYYDALFDTDRVRALEVIENALDSGFKAEDIVFSIVTPCMEKMSGGMLHDSVVTLSQHFLSSQIAEEIVDMLIPKFAMAPLIQGRIVIGTSFGDFHGLGKKIVTGCLRAKLFYVKDLGINVAPERFVEEAIAENAQVIGISTMMLHCAVGENGPKKVRAILGELGLEKRIKIVVGGAPYRFHDGLYRKVGADAWAENAVRGAEVIAALVREMDGR